MVPEPRTRLSERKLGLAVRWIARFTNQKAKNNFLVNRFLNDSGLGGATAREVKCRAPCAPKTLDWFNAFSLRVGPWRLFRTALHGHTASPKYLTG